jgi:acetyl-CoA carboxylase biotin carboxyl carrier protein
MTKKSTHKENLSIVQEFVNMVNKDNLLELEYEANDFKVKVVKNMKNSFSAPQETVISVPDIRENKDVSKPIEKVEQFTNKHPGAINSPMVGTAYSAPEPGKDPFIKLNSQVSKGDTLLIIEAMKVMNTIVAPKSGKVIFIGFEDSQPVEFDQLLVVIE